MRRAPNHANLRALANKRLGPSVTFAKPSEDHLELRIRFYSPQKEEQYPIITNPQKRPKRAKKGFFASVKSLFSTNKDEPNENSSRSGRRGSSDVGASGRRSSIDPSGEGKEGRRGSGTKETLSQHGSGSGQLSANNTPLMSAKGDDAYVPPLALNLNDVKDTRRSSLQPVPSPALSASKAPQFSDCLSEDDDSDSDFDNDHPETSYNTRVNTSHSPKADVCDLLLSWEMFYSGFQEFTPRDSTNFVSFTE